MQGIQSIDENKYRKILDHVSVSELNLFRAAPSLYKYRILDGHRDPPTKSQLEGTAIHAAILEPEKFKSEYVQLPILDLRTTEGKKAKSKIEFDNPTKKLIPFDDYIRFVNAQQAVRNNKEAIKYLLDCEFEQSFFWTDPITGVRCKARADAISKTSDFIVDLKTSRDPANFARSIAEYGYHRQASFYLRGATEASGRVYSRWIWIVVHPEAPHLCAVYEASEQLLWQGAMECTELLTRFKECKETNTWGGLPEVTQIISLPAWYMQQNLPSISLGNLTNEGVN